MRDDVVPMILGLHELAAEAHRGPRRFAQKRSENVLHRRLMEHVRLEPARRRAEPGILKAQQHLPIGVDEVVGGSQLGVRQNILHDAELLENPHDLVIEMGGPRHRIDLGGFLGDEDPDAIPGQQCGQRRPNRPKADDADLALIIGSGLDRQLDLRLAHCLDRAEAIDLAPDPVAGIQQVRGLHGGSNVSRRASEDEVARKPWPTPPLGHLTADRHMLKKHYAGVVRYCHEFERTNALPYGFNPMVRMIAPMGPSTIAASSKA